MGCAIQLLTPVNVACGVQGLVPSGVQGPVPSGVQGPVPSGVQGPVPSGVQGPVPSGVQGPLHQGVHGMGSLPSTDRHKMLLGVQGFLVGFRGIVPGGVLGEGGPCQK